LPFEATLQSLVNQTDQRFHVYIGDDASPENPLPLLEKYRQNDFSYYRFEENLVTVASETMGTLPVIGRRVILGHDSGR
jgi:hypothetical protein